MDPALRWAEELMEDVFKQGVRKLWQITGLYLKNLSAGSVASFYYLYGWLKFLLQKMGQINNTITLSCLLLKDLVVNINFISASGVYRTVTMLDQKIFCIINWVSFSFKSLQSRKVQEKMFFKSLNVVFETIDYLGKKIIIYGIR